MSYLASLGVHKLTFTSKDKETGIPMMVNDDHSFRTTVSRDKRVNLTVTESKVLTVFDELHKGHATLQRLQQLLSESNVAEKDSSKEYEDEGARVDALGSHEEEKARDIKKRFINPGKCYLNLFF